MQCIDFDFVPENSLQTLTACKLSGKSGALLYKRCTRNYMQSFSHTIFYIQNFFTRSSQETMGGGGGGDFSIFVS